jgi:large subunit ribosomal protein L4e
MKANIIGIDGSAKGNIELPKVFETAHKPVLIRRAVLAIQSAKKQPKGTDPRAGKKTTAIYIGIGGAPAGDRGKNVEHARLPRMKNKRNILSGRVGRVAHAVGGRMANPPKAWKVIEEKINKKEKRLALASAIAATADKKLVTQRFIFDGELPLVVDDSFEKIDKTQKVFEAFGKIGVEADLNNARSKVRRRAGKGKARGRKTKIKKSVLIITASNDKVLKASRNLIGVEAVTLRSLNVELLAPGGEAGRLVVWTRGAIEELAEKNKKVKETSKKVVKEKKTKSVVKVNIRKNERAKRRVLDAQKKAKKASSKPVQEEDE